MDKKIERKLEKKIGKTEVKALKKDLEKEIRKDVEKEVEKEVRKEIKKEIKLINLHRKIYSKTKTSALAFRGEFQKHVFVAISAALGFLIALSWRTPIKNSVDTFISSLGLGGQAIYLEYLSAILITIIAVLVLMWMTRWEVKSQSK